MAFVDEFADLMTDIVSLAPMLSRDTYGNPTYGAAVDWYARVVYKRSVIRSRSGMIGAEVLSSGFIILKGVADITEDMKITLADGSTPRVVNWETHTDENGPVYTKIFFG